MNPLRTRCWLLSALLVFFPSLAMAYSLVLRDGENLDEKSLQDQKSTELSYGITSVEYKSQEVDRVKLDKPAPVQVATLSLVGVAEAATPPIDQVIQSYLAAHQTIKGAEHIEELQGFVTQHYYQSLIEKKNQGAPDVVLLEMIRNLMPDNPHVYDNSFEHNQVQLATTANSVWGKMDGVATMVEENGTWKLLQQKWYTSDRELKAMAPLLSVNSTYNPDLEIKDVRQAFDLQSSKYKINYNPLSLSRSRARSKLPKDSFVFVFYVKKGEKLKQRIEDPHPDVVADKKPRLHLVWTGPKQMVPKQRSYQNQYPLDLSIANENEGYLSDNVNLRFPKKKPRGVTVEFLMEF